MIFRAARRRLAPMFPSRRRWKNAPGEVPEPFGTLPALAIGYTAPPRQTQEWYALTVLDRVLHGGRAGRIYRQLVLEKQIAVETDGSFDAFDTNGPTQMVTRVFHRPEYSADATIADF